MFCPLCKAEYRSGFRECSDCHIALVATEGEAASMGVDCVWKGDERWQCNRVLDALIAANLPFRYRELLKKRAWPWISIFLYLFIRPRPTFEFQIWVLHRDFARAIEAMPKEQTDDEKDDD